MFYLICYSDGEISQEIPLRNNSAGLLAIHLMDSMHAMDHDDSGEMHYFNLSTILTATNDFSEANKLGEGGFGPVYKVTRQINFFMHMHFWKLIDHLHLIIIYIYI